MIALANTRPVEPALVTDQCIRLLQLNIAAKNIGIESVIPIKTIVDPSEKTALTIKFQNSGKNLTQAIIVFPESVITSE